MQTLPPARSTYYLSNPTHYRMVRRHWGQLMRSDRKHELNAAHHLLYLALMGRDWRRAFTPIQSVRALDHGGFYDWGLLHAWNGLHSQADTAALLAPFDGLVTIEMLERVQAILPQLRFYQMDPYRIAREGLQCDPYRLTVGTAHE